MIRNRSLVCAIVLTTPVMAQQFQLGLTKDVLDQNTVASITYPAAGDLDGDGLPELLFATTPYFGGKGWLFRNQGTHFEPVPSNALPPEIRGTISLADIDGDGDLDVIESSSDLRVFDNDGNGGLTETTDERLPPGIWAIGKCSLADIENDGDVDILMPVGRILVNNGQGVFHDETSRRLFTNGFAIGQLMAARDFDNDGDTDLVLMSGLHRNDGNGVFTVDPNANFTHSYGESPLAMDADLDGDVDILLTSGRMFDNDGKGRFTETANVLPTNEWGSAFLFELSDIADIDGDGAVDLLVSPNHAHSGLQPSWVPNNGNGTFLFDQLHPLPCELLRTNHLVAHDLDADGDTDLVLTEAWSQTPSPVEVLYNNGDGTFHNAVEVGGLKTLRAYDRVVVDFDNDGDSDVLAGAILHRNDGQGAFTTEWLSPLAHSYHYVDLNGDGLLDAIDGRSTWLQQANLTFAEQQVLLGPLEYTRSAMSIDFDNDQDQDVIILAGPYPSPVTPRIYQNDGQGNLTLVDPATLGLDGLEPQVVKAGDFDNDGDDDLVMGFPGFFAWGGFPCRLFANDGSGNFTEVPMPASQWPISRIQVVDMDSDGDPDLLLESNNLLYLNQGNLQFAVASTGIIASHPVPADINNDGYVDIWASVNGWPQPFLNDGSFHFTAAPELVDPTRAYHPAPDFFAIDLEGDGDMDLIATPEDANVSAQYLVPIRNHLRQLRAPYLTKVGGQLQLELSSHDETSGVQLSLIGVSTTTTRVDLGSIGVLGIDMASAATFLETWKGSSAHDIAIPMPNNPSLIGTTLHAQALLVTPSGMHLTGTVDSFVL